MQAEQRIRREEYDRLVDLGTFDRQRVELIRGVIVRMTPQGASHAGPLIAPDDSEPEPDVAVVPLSDPHRAHPDAAHLVIEVARSSQRYDRETKGPLYAEMGVPEYWLVDVEAQVIEVHREPRTERYAQVERVTLDASIALVAFPDVRIDVSAVLR